MFHERRSTYTHRRAGAVLRGVSILSVTEEVRSKLGVYMGADYASEGWSSVVWWPEGRRGGSCCTAESGRTDVRHLGTGARVEKPNLTPRLQVGVSVQGGDKNRKVRAAVCREGILRSLVQGLESPDSALPVVAKLPLKGRSQEGGSHRRQSKGLPARGGHTTAVSLADAATTQMEQVCPAAWQTPGCQARPPFLALSWARC